MFVYRVEGTGALPAAEVVLGALEVLEAKLRRCADALEGERARVDTDQQPMQ
jgi:hypothetical protein